MASFGKSVLGGATFLQVLEKYYQDYLEKGKHLEQQTLCSITKISSTVQYQAELVQSRETKKGAEMS